MANGNQHSDEEVFKMISQTTKTETNLWALYHALQQQLRKTEIDRCIDLICQIHDVCTEILVIKPDDQLAREMEFSFIPSMIRELCDANYERMAYIFGEPFGEE